MEYCSACSLKERAVCLDWPGPSEGPGFLRVLTPRVQSTIRARSFLERGRSFATPKARLPGLFRDRVPLFAGSHGRVAEEPTRIGCRDRSNPNHTSTQCYLELVFGRSFHRFVEGRCRTLEAKEMIELLIKEMEDYKARSPEIARAFEIFCITEEVYRKTLETMLLSRPTYVSERTVSSCSEGGQYGVARVDY